MCGQQAYCFPVPLISIADKVFWSKKNFRILPISLFRAPPHFDIPSYGSSQQFGHWPLAILSSRLMTQITLMTAAILPISPFWQLRDKAVTTVTYNPQRLDLSYMRGLGSSPYMRVWDWIPRWYRWWQQWPTSWPSVLTEDQQWWRRKCQMGLFISRGVQLAGKYQTARKYQGIYFMSGNDEGEISDCALVYRDHRDLHRTTRQTHFNVCIRIHTHAYIRVYVYTIHTDAFQSPTGTCSIYGISLFLTNLLIHSVCLLFKQTN